MQLKLVNVTLSFKCIFTIWYTQKAMKVRQPQKQIAIYCKAKKENIFSWNRD